MYDILSTLGLLAKLAPVVFVCKAPNVINFILKTLFATPSDEISNHPGPGIVSV